MNWVIVFFCLAVLLVASIWLIWLITRYRWERIASGAAELGSVLWRKKRAVRSAAARRARGRMHAAPHSPGCRGDHSQRHAILQSSQVLQPQPGDTINATGRRRVWCWCENHKTHYHFIATIAVFCRSYLPPRTLIVLCLTITMIIIGTRRTFYIKSSYCSRTIFTNRSNWWIAVWMWFRADKLILFVWADEEVLI